MPRVSDPFSETNQPSAAAAGRAIPSSALVQAARSRNVRRVSRTVIATPLAIPPKGGNYRVPKDTRFRLKAETTERKNMRFRLKAETTECKRGPTFPYEFC